jgi:hypothetical protein
MSMFKGGGGYLKGVTLTILGITFDSKEWPAKSKGKDPYSTLSAKLSFRIDGATADAFTFLPAGFFYPENQTISEDGATLGSDRDGAIIAGDTEFAKFINSIDALDPSVFEGSDGRNFDAAKGLRVTTDRIVDEAKTKEFGKRKGKMKDGKTAEFNRDYLVVKAVLGKVEVKAAGKAPVASSKKPVAGKAAAAPKASKAAPAASGTEAADTALLAIVAEAGGSVERKVMGSKATRYRLKANLDEAAGEALRTQLMSDEYINDAVVRGLIDLDGGTITKA